MRSDQNEDWATGQRKPVALPYMPAPPPPPMPAGGAGGGGGAGIPGGGGTPGGGGGTVVVGQSCEGLAQEVTE